MQLFTSCTVVANVRRTPHRGTAAALVTKLSCCLSSQRYNRGKPCARMLQSRRVSNLPLMIRGNSALMQASA